MIEYFNAFLFQKIFYNQNVTNLSKKKNDINSALEKERKEEKNQSFTDSPSHKFPN